MKSSTNSLDQYQATNYQPIMSNEEKEVAEAELASAKDLDILDDLNDLYEKTRVLQRHSGSLSVSDQLEKFPWLKYVSTLVSFSKHFNWYRVK